MIKMSRSRTDLILWHTLHKRGNR
uniref:Uncharacterized protein n=1 Tax=Anguilla anguilla TaxID=7936 RepID=A0A0E9U6E1_ANGAN